jgi:hypothetical protein
MYTLIQFSGGVIVEAVVLVWQPNSMRVAAAGFPDAIELSRSDSRWFTDAGQYVELDFLFNGAPQAGFVSSPTALSRAAGQAAMD